MIVLAHIRMAAGLNAYVTELKQAIEMRVNLSDYPDGTRPSTIFNNTVQRLALIAGLSLNHERDVSELEAIELQSSTFHDTVFSKGNYTSLWSALLSIRYPDINGEDKRMVDQAVNNEMINGFKFLLKDKNLDQWLTNEGFNDRTSSTSGIIPPLKLDIGVYEDNIPAKLDLNSKDILNTQILIAGTTGSGKSNLLSVILNEIRSASVESDYPVQFLLFDYKGEFSSEDFAQIREYLEVDDDAILNPLSDPLPFNPFKDFLFKPDNELNLYSTELSTALCALDRATISANMSDRLTTAVINAYQNKKRAAVTFRDILEEYTALQTGRAKDDVDSIKALLNQLIRAKLFSNEDKFNLHEKSLILKMDGFPKDGPIAKAIVYFTIAKLNMIYDELSPQAVDENNVQIRHLTVIDEAHYMLDFDNRPLRNLIAIGRNKGMSVALATQNMESFKSKYFDYCANAQYPLIMRQQTINDKIIKDLFGVSGNEFNEIKKTIAGLKKGELIIKNHDAFALGIGKKYKKIYVKLLQ